MRDPVIYPLIGLKTKVPNTSDCIWSSNSLGTIIMTQLVELTAQTLSSVAQTVKRLPAMWETWVRSLGREDPLEKEMATHSSTLAWKIPWTEKPCKLQSPGSQRVGHHWATSLLLTYWYLFYCALHSRSWIFANRPSTSWKACLHHLCPYCSA